MAIDYDPGEYIAALGNISSLLDKDAGLGSANIANLNNIGVSGNPFLNFIPQQGPILGPDEFGSYTIPMSDPTYRSGFDYARSIAGGMPMEQVIAPGVSYSPEQPGGYTQAQLNTPVGTTPVEPPQKLPEPDDPRYLGTGIGGVTIFDDVFDKKRMPPLRDIFGGRRDTSSMENLINIGKLFDTRIDKDAINKMIQDRIAKSMPIENIPSSIPEVPTGREFSVDRQPIPPQDFGYGPGIMPPLPPIYIDKVIPPKINDQIFIDDRPIIDERIVDRGYGPGIMPPLPPMDIDKLIPPVDIPPVDIPPVDRPLIMDTPTIMDRPTGGRFSIEQQRPMGLFI